MAKKKVVKDITPLFNAEQIQTLSRILYGTWEYIGNDIMDAVLTDGGESITSEAVVEVVLDADHCTKMVRELKAEALWATFQEHPYDQRMAFARKHAFPAKRYS